jgi:hypothetical protein
MQENEISNVFTEFRMLSPEHTEKRTDGQTIVITKKGYKKNSGDLPVTL